MKKTIKINLSGIIFHIDDDAYDKLESYLDNIARHFSDSQESKEITDDIEARIAELFQERISSENQVVTIEIVTEVISIMGNPEDIADNGDQNGSQQGSYESPHSSRKLYRDIENSVVAGVSSGLGAYFRVDPVLFRVLFAIFVFVGFSGPIVYTILWIVLPRAETAAQKLEMRGEKVNVSNLEKKIRAEYDHVKDNVQKGATKVRKEGSDFFEVLGRILLIFLKVILIIIGANLVLAGVALLVALIAVPFAGMYSYPFDSQTFSLGDLILTFSDPASITLMFIATMLLVLIPIVAMIYGIIRVIFNIKTRNKVFGIILLSLWVLSLLGIIAIAVMESRIYSKSGRSMELTELTISSDTLHISINADQEEFLEDESILDIDDEWYLLEDEDSYFGKMVLDIEEATGEQFGLELVKRAKGKGQELALENAENIQYKFRIRENELILDPYYSVDLQDKWRFQKVEANILIPQGKVVVLDRETRKYLDNVRTTSGHQDWSMAGESWKMTKEGLELIAE